MKTNLGELLRKYRKGIRLTQKDVADTLGIDRSTYAYYEGGRSAPPLETLVKLSNMYNVATDDLLGNAEKALKLRQNPVSYKRDSSDISSGWLSEEERALVIAFRKLKVNRQEEIKTAIKDFDEKDREFFRTSSTKK